MEIILNINIILYLIISFLIHQILTNRDGSLILFLIMITVIIAGGRISDISTVLTSAIIISNI